MSAFDRGLLFGDGVFETLRAYGGVVFRLERHLDRLARSLKAIEICWPVDAAAIRRAIAELMEANGLSDARLRLTVTGGEFEGVIRLGRSHPPTVILSAVPIRPPSPEEHRRGIDLHIAAFRQPWAWPLARVKTIHRLAYLIAREEALRASAHDALILDDRGGLAEGTSSNIFMVAGGRVITPSIEGPILAGVTREAALEAARECGLVAEERFIPLEELWQAAEVFVTATSWEVLAVRSVNGRRVGPGERGILTARIHETLRAMIRRETAGQA